VGYRLGPKDPRGATEQRLQAARVLYRDPKLSGGLHADLFGNAAKIIPVILQRAADRGEIKLDISARVAMLPVNLFRHELLKSSTRVAKRTLVEIVDDIFLPLVATKRPGWQRRPLDRPAPVRSDKPRPRGSEHPFHSALTPVAMSEATKRNDP
jgi:hypothetical protein